MTDRAESYRLLIADVYELAGASRAASGAVAAAHGQTVPRWHVLSVLSGGQRTVPDVARRLGLARQSVQRVADELTAADLVSAATNPAHARSPLLELTAQGRQVLNRLTSAGDADRARALRLAGVSAGELAEARKVLQALIRGLRAAGADDPL